VQLVLFSSPTSSKEQRPPIYFLLFFCFVSELDSYFSCACVCAYHGLVQIVIYRPDLGQQQEPGERLVERFFDFTSTLHAIMQHALDGEGVGASNTSS